MRSLRTALIKLVFLYLTLIFNSSVGAEEFDWIKTNLDSQSISAIETTPYGLFAGENDNFAGSTRHNGIYFTHDLGSTWVERGLGKRGITDIAYGNDKVYVTTKFVVNNQIGLFASSDKGNTWEYFPQVRFGTSAVGLFGNTIVLGGTNNGLWVSFDNGLTWEQKIGTGFFGPYIYEIKLAENIFLISTDNAVYKSFDQGNTWEQIPFFTGKKARSIEIQDDFILIGTNNVDGMFRSFNLGESWEYIQSWGKNTVGGISYFNGTIYAGKINDQGSRTIMKSKDFGSTWADTNLVTRFSVDNSTDLAWVYTVPNLLFATTENDGLYKTELPAYQYSRKPFLAIPWKSQKENELLDRITSYFDHEYPLLGYKYFSESESNNKTTVNFLGIKDSPPKLYYSSHDGYDFDLKYGTEILAPYEGYASYYYCYDCGNTIKIDHLNGYQSTYMHLQKEGLIATTDIPVWVNKGDTIGKVGMTGNTSGPHLHFVVLKDKNLNQLFDDFPEGKVDPFGWQSEFISDPWTTYSWQDVLGTHTGTQSTYLWDVYSSVKEETLDATEHVITHENKQVKLPRDITRNPVTLNIRNHFKPTHPTLQYVPHTSFLLTAHNYLQHEVRDFSLPIEIEVDFKDSDLTNVITSTIKLYTFNMYTNLWEPLITKSLDLENMKITSETNHFSHFALFGEKINSQLPNIDINVEGDNIDGWYTSPPLITLSTNKPNTIIYYKLGDEIDWIEYSRPFRLEKDGVYTIEYKAVDEFDTWSNTYESELFRVNTNGLFNTLRVTNTHFQMN